jgi:hypothetical protein
LSEDHGSLNRLFVGSFFIRSFLRFLIPSRAADSTESARAIARDYPTLTVAPLLDDFTRALSRVPRWSFWFVSRDSSGRRPALHWQSSCNTFEKNCSDSPWSNFWW